MVFDLERCHFFAAHGLAIDVQHAVDHLNAIARQADDAFDEIAPRLRHGLEHGDVAAFTASARTNAPPARTR